MTTTSILSLMQRSRRFSIIGIIREFSATERNFASIDRSASILGPSEMLGLMRPIELMQINRIIDFSAASVR